MRNDSYNRDPEIFRCVNYSVSVKLIFMKLKTTAYFIHCIKLSESMYTNINFPAVFYINGDKIPYVSYFIDNYKTYCLKTQNTLKKRKRL